ncbi:hypothetical protein Kpho01_30870 [Kitasatospora phosalacinea]|uniref:Uncharacterized protein n=1 Tax=Kitasatospora phosalacinea TaxID=2065 RepID=A0A9W6UM48_9ACTN|nr:hypothetical protein Kpho01_30870 [Kitasatospora phosalacinea]
MEAPVERAQDGGLPRAGLPGARTPAAVAAGVERVAQGVEVREGDLLGEPGQQAAQAPLVPVADGFGKGCRQ